MILTRDRGNRMWGGDGTSGGGGGGVSSSQLAGMLIGYATETWVDEHYISIDFFSRLFQAHGTENGSEIDVMPNDLETTITSVESMFGFWTNLYISALGSNGAAPAGISLGMLTDVNISGTPSAGQVLTYDAVSGKWVNGNAQAGATALANLTDVLLTTPQTNQVLIYDTVQAKWINTPLKTINTISIIGSGDISVGGGASGNYLPLAGGTITGTLVIDVAGTTQTNNGLYFRNPAVGAYNLSIFPYNHEATYTDGLSINGYDGISFCTGSNSRQERMRITQSGRVGILTTAPSYTLDIAGNMRIQSSDDRYLRLFGNTSLWTLIAFKDDSKIFGLYDGASQGGATYFYSSLSMEVNGRLTASTLYATAGTVCINAFSYGANYGISFRYGYEGTYNTSITVYNHTSSAYDGISINGYNGVSICTGSNARQERLRVDWNGSVGIGTTSPEYKLHVAGTIYATGAITALSDARKKDITGEAGVSVEQIAHAPAVQFLWKDKERRKDGQQVGTLAQYWKTVLPEVVMDKGGELSMQYGVAALVSAIVTARKVVDHERRITELEKENERLKEEISQLRLN